MASHSWLTTGDRLGNSLCLASALFVLVPFVSHAWVSEDAHITIRTIDNLVDGYGLRWNVDERVQAYTHPLWLLVLTPFYAFTREIYTTLTVVALVFSVGAYVLVASHFRDHPRILVAAVFMPVMLSSTLVRYSTSGFETSLTLFLIVAFAVLLLRSREEAIPWGRLGLIAALCAVNRLDAILLVAPGLAWLIAVHRRDVAWGRLLAGMTPLVAWLAFSLFYYGFLFPNTAYAKLNPEISRLLHLKSGLRYVADTLVVDPASGVLLVLGAAATVAVARRAIAGNGDSTAGRLAAVGAGALLYGAYVVWIGGDFLSGRFLAGPVMLSIIACAGWLRGRAEEPGEGKSTSWVAVAACCAVLVVATQLAARAAMSLSAEPIRTAPIARVELVWGDGDPWPRWNLSDFGKGFWEEGVKLRRAAEEQQQRVQVLAVVGLAGVAAGRDVLIIDRFALGDPLLARLPPRAIDRFSAGHSPRDVPRGYIRARETGDPSFMDPSLAEYYSRLRVVISGPLLSWRRLLLIARFSVGAFDPLLEEYLARDSSGEMGPGRGS